MSARSRPRSISGTTSFSRVHRDVRPFDPDTHPRPADRHRHGLQLSWHHLYNGELTYKYLISSYRSLACRTNTLAASQTGTSRRRRPMESATRRSTRSRVGFYSNSSGDSTSRAAGGWEHASTCSRRNSITKDGVVWNPYTGQWCISATSQHAPALHRHARIPAPPSFSRFRLQYAFDRSRFLDGVQKKYPRGVAPDETRGRPPMGAAIFQFL